MGEIADMILDGFLDEETGEYIDGEAPGYPRRMSEMEAFSEGASRHAKDTKCPICSGNSVERQDLLLTELPSNADLMARGCPGCVHSAH